MGRRKLPPNSMELELRREIKQRFQDAMRFHHISTQTEAAEQIGVRKATFSLYMKEKSTPSSFVLLKACEKWGISIHYRGVEFTSKHFAKTEKARSQAHEQRSLFEALNDLSEDKIGVTIGRRGPDSVKLSLQIRFSMSNKDI